MEFTDEEIRQEMARRGMLESQKEFPREEEFSDEAIRAEMQKRGMLEPQDPNIPLMAAQGALEGAVELADLPQNFGKLMVNQAREFSKRLPELSRNEEKNRKDRERAERNDEGINEYIGSPSISQGFYQKARDYGVDLQSEQPKTPMQKIGRYGSKFAGSSLIPIAGIAKTPMQAASMLGTSALAGLGSGTAQELGVNPMVADIGASIAAPLAISTAKSIAGAGSNLAKTAFSPKYRESLARRAGEEEAAHYLQDVVGRKNIDQVLSNIESHQSPIGYRGTTAEKAENIGLAQLERSKQGSIREVAERHAADNSAIRNHLEGLSPGEHDIHATRSHFSDVATGYDKGVERALSDLSDIASPREAGRRIRDPIASKLEAAKSERYQASRPHYEKLESYEKGLNPSETKNLIDEKLKTAKGPLRSALNRIKKDLKRNEPEPGMVSPRPIELKNTVDVINDSISIAKRNGANTRARHLQEVKESLLKDLEKIPAERRARKAFAENSPPINEIMDNPEIARILKKDKFEKDFILKNHKVPKETVGKVIESFDDATNFLKHTTTDSRAAISGYLNNKVVESITDASGSVDVKKIAAWRKRNPGAFVLYPELETKLKNLRNAQTYVNHVRLKNVKEADSFFKGAFQAVEGNNPNKVVRSIFSGKNKSAKFDRALEIAATDDTGAATEGLKRAIVNDLKQQTGLNSLDANKLENISYPSFTKYLKENRAELSKAFSPDQMKFIDGIHDGLRKRQFVASVAGSIGSPTAANLTVLEMLMQGRIDLLTKRAISKVWGGDKFLEFIDGQNIAAKNKIKDELINSALVDDDTAKFLLKHPLNPKETKSMSDYIKNRAYLAAPVLRQADEK